MKKVLLSILLGTMLISCASKKDVAPAPVPVAKEIAYTVVIEGLESEYYSSIVESIEGVSTYKEHSVVLAKDGVFETKIYLEDAKGNDKEVYEALNSVFQTLSKTIDVEKSRNAIKIKITNY